MTPSSLYLAVLVFQHGHFVSDDNHDIQVQYNRWSRAYMAHDVDTLLDLLAPDYTLTSVDKDVMTFATYKAFLELKKKAPKETTEYSTRILHLTRQGALAKVDCVESMVTHKANKPGHVSLTIHKHEYLDTWKLAGSVWRLSCTVTVKESTALKSVPHLR